MAEAAGRDALNAAGAARLVASLKTVAAPGLAAGLVVGCVDAAWLLLHAGAAAGGARFFAWTEVLYAAAGVLGAVVVSAIRRVLRRRAPKAEPDGGRLCFAIVAAVGLTGVVTVHCFSASVSAADKFISRGLIPAAAALALAVAAAAWVRRGRTTRGDARGHGRWWRWIVVPFGLAAAYGLLFVAVDAGGSGRAGALDRLDRARPHVLLIVMDAMRADRMSAYGHSRPTTPNLERRARGGVRFANAYTTANWTAPAHASLFTGRPASVHALGWRRTRLPADIPTLAEILSAHGYRTLSLHDNAFTGRLVGLDRGFDEEWGVEAESRIDSALALVLSRSALGRGHSPRLVEVARRWIGSAARRGRPAFVFVHFNDAHAPYRRREPYFDRFARGLDLSGVDLRRVRTVNADRHAFHRFLSGEVQLSPGDFDYLRALYDSEIAFVDEQIERLLRGLQADGVLENTVVVVTADHGESIGEHGLMGHHVLLYNEVLRIPLLVWAPGKVVPGVEQAPASLVDVTPTILGLVGLAGEVRPAMEGRDLLSAPADGARGADPASRGVFAEWWGLLLSRPRARLETSLFAGKLTAQRIFALIESGADKDWAKAVIRGRWKLVWVSDGRIELYDLAADPGESRRLDAERPDVVRQLAATLADKIRRESPAGRPPDERDRDFERALRSLGYIR